MWKPWREATQAPPPSAPSDPGQPGVAGYTILSELGRGAMGVVYKARHDRLKRIVALKMIRVGPNASAGDLARFHAEAEAVAHLHHHNIIQIYEIGEQDGLPYLALEFVGGGTLKDRLKGAIQPVADAAQLVQTLARAVHTAHVSGIVHRDLKPANILLAAHSSDDPDTTGSFAATTDHYGVPKITDFGLAKRRYQDTGWAEDGQAVGTPAYMAPEQADGRTEEIGPSADIYALGAILYEMLTGGPPFKARTVGEMLHLVTTTAPAPPRQLRRELSRNLEAICLKCLEKDPRKRYRTALALADDLQRFLRGELVHARPAGAVGRLWNWCLRNPIPASLLFTVTVVLVVGVWNLSRLSDRMVIDTAVESASHQTEMLREMNSLYTSVANQAKGSDLKATHLFNPQDPEPKTIPIPARFTILLGERMERLDNEAERGERQGRGITRLRVYSNYPFRNREDSPPRHTFGKDAMSYFEDKENAKGAFHRVEKLRSGRVLLYATPLFMSERCLVCHNNKDLYKNPETAKTDWKAGDVRGVLEILRPLNDDMEKTQQTLLAEYALMGGGTIVLLGLCGLVLTLGKRWQG